MRLKAQPVAGGRHLKQQMVFFTDGVLRPWEEARDRLNAYGSVSAMTAPGKLPVTNLPLSPLTNAPFARMANWSMLIIVDCCAAGCSAEPSAYRD